ncbi:protease HtpX [Methylacidiphilum kamchatkense Kam1]|uniref:Protease HtpX homolog n=1 Tax=Methylacidiphilum kamchatkense Kam1 TaxID=1202785 RepID=A0A0C1UTK0_9BACT|nr:protease HtpX [Methylacidiphilum kamchatkense]KIE59113.1 protease HtpX [Methylacidiphilum kamchatkense Kam1]QDQ42970.1 heat shock protein [Methylacidiphilum kamchatkense Kam1]
MFKRVFLLILTNIAVIVLLTLFISIFHLDRWLTAYGIDYWSLFLFSLVVGFTGSFISLAISKWMAKMAYNIQVIQQPSNEAERWLLETVRELANRANIPMPEVGIYESPEVNAFATGPSRSNALVAVSTGILEHMNKKQIAGVLGHEITHISNGDMVTMTLLQGVVNTFVVFLSRIIGFFIDRLFSRNDERESIGIGFYMGMFISEIVLGLLASFIVAWYSRMREFRADAGGAHLAGKEAMLSALKKLKQIMEGESAFIDERAPALNTFKINGRPGGILALLATHPPLEERIKALENLPEE